MGGRGSKGGARGDGRRVYRREPGDWLWANRAFWTVALLALSALLSAFRFVTLPQGGSVTAADVDAIVYRDTEYKIYEMTDALGRGNHAAYLSVMNELLGKGMDEAGVLNALCNYFRTLYEILALGKSDAETAKALGMKEYAVKMSRRQARMLGAARTGQAYFSVYGAVSAVKSGRLTPQGALAAVNARLFFGGTENNAG